MKNICLLRLSAIGDTTHVLPIIHGIQKRYPKAHITWIIGYVESQLMEGLPGVEFIVFNKNKGLSEWVRIWQVLRKRQFDVLLHMQLSFRSNMLALLVKSSRKIGYDKRRSKELHSCVINERIKYLDQQHVLDGFIQFAHAIDVSVTDYQWFFSLREADHAYAENIVQHKPSVIISHSSSHPLRNWHAEGYAQVADYLTDRYRAQVILCGGRSSREKKMAEQICQYAQLPLIDITGGDTLKQLVALMQRVDLVISPDSGPLHIAGAVGTPVIGLHAASNYKRSGSYQYSDLVVDQYPQACKKAYNKDISELRWGIKVEQEGIMDLITTELVIKRIDAWYKRYYQPLVNQSQERAPLL